MSSLYTFKGIKDKILNFMYIKYSIHCNQFYADKNAIGIGPWQKTSTESDYLLIGPEGRASLRSEVPAEVLV